MSKKYGGFTRAEIEEQARFHSTSAGSNKNFLFLKNPDGALSNTCVKIAWGFSYGSLNDEHAWLKKFQSCITSAGLKTLKFPEPVVLFGNYNTKEQFLVMKSDSTVQTIRQIMDKSGGQLDPMLANMIAAALSALRSAMGSAIGLSTAVSPISQEDEGWLVRGWAFGEGYSRKYVRTVQDLLDYMASISAASDKKLPSTEKLSWNHGDPSSRNLGYSNGVIHVWDFGRSVYGPSWIDGHAIHTCDTVDYTLPMMESFTEYGMGIEEDELMLIEGFRSWFATRGLSFDIAKK